MRLFQDSSTCIVALSILLSQAAAFARVASPIRAENLAGFTRLPVHRVVLNLVERGEPESAVLCPGFERLLRSVEPLDRFFAGLWWLRVGIPHLAAPDLFSAVGAGSPDGLDSAATLLLGQAAAGADVAPVLRVGPILAAVARTSGEQLSRVRYVLGRELLSAGTLETADTLLSGVPLTHEDFGRASYLRGAIATSTGRLAFAADSFAATLRAAELSGDRELEDVGRLAIGRVAAEAGLWEVSEYHLRGIRSGTRHWDEAAWELASVVLLAGRPAEALQALSARPVAEFSPFARPESGVLITGAIDRLCHFESARDAALEWGALLQATADRLEDAMAMAIANEGDRWLEYLVGGAPEDADPVRLTLEADAGFRDAALELARIDREIAVASGLPEPVSGIARNRLAPLRTEARNQRAKAAYAALDRMSRRVQESMSMTSEGLIDSGEHQIDALREGESTFPVEPLVLATLVDLARRGAAESSMREEARKIIGKRAFSLGPRDAAWLHAHRVPAATIEWLGTLVPLADRTEAGKRPTTRRDSGILWDLRVRTWIASRPAGTFGGLSSLCGGSEREESR